jgi:hypothetical protein
LLVLRMVSLNRPEIAARFNTGDRMHRRHGCASPVARILPSGVSLSGGSAHSPRYRAAAPTCIFGRRCVNRAASSRSSARRSGSSRRTRSPHGRGRNERSCRTGVGGTLRSCARSARSDREGRASLPDAEPEIARERIRWWPRLDAIAPSAA